jgi:hypothetical protein
MLGDVSVWGFDTYSNQRGDVYDLGLANVDIWPVSPCKLLRMEGNWHTAIFRDVGGNYTAPDGYGIELAGPFEGANNPNADCHFSNCFFDALFMSGQGPGGLVFVQDCFEVHLRDSLLRVAYVPHPPAFEPISAVRTFRSPGNSGLTNVIIEGSSLYGPPPSVLDVGADTFCFFRHSSTDSKSGDGQFFASGPDGIGNR